MNIFKKCAALILAICMIFCAVGCAEEEYDEYDNFDPVGVLVVDCIYGDKYETQIEDADYAKKMLDKFKELEINTEVEGEIGTAYLYLRFYDKGAATMLIFTIYENGSCCLGEDFTEIYTVTNGVRAYSELCEMYTEYKEN